MDYLAKVFPDKSVEELKTLFKNNPEIIRDHQGDEIMCRIAINQNIHCADMIDNKTIQIWKSIVTKDPMLINSVDLPEEALSEVQILFVDMYRNAMYIDNPTVKACLFGLKYRHFYRTIRSDDIRKIIADKAIEAYPGNIEYVPDLSDEQIDKAISLDGNCIVCLSEEQQTSSRCWAALENTPDALLSIIDVTSDMYLYAVNKNPTMIKHIPKHLITGGMIYKAIVVDPRIISDLPHDIIDETMCNFAIDTLPSAVGHIHKCLLTSSMIYRALRKTRSSIYHVPPEFIDADMCTYAVSTNERILQHIPLEFITRDLCELAIAHYPYNINDVPKEFITKELLKHAHDISPYSLHLFCDDHCAKVDVYKGDIDTVIDTILKSI